jgi:hypothetical protein
VTEVLVALNEQVANGVALLVVEGDDDQGSGDQGGQ